MTPVRAHCAAEAAGTPVVGSLAQGSLAGTWETVSVRNNSWPLGARTALLKVPRLGEKAFEQAAGFLRIRGGKNPLDASAVHPEAYPVVEKLLERNTIEVAPLAFIEP